MKRAITFLALIIFLSGCSTAQKTYYEIPKSEVVEPKNTPKSTDKPNEPDKNGDYTASWWDDVYHTDTDIKSISGFDDTDNHSSHSLSNVSDIVQSIRERFYDTQGKISSMVCKTDGDGIQRYYENARLRKITIPQGVHCEPDFYFSREYYFDDTEMYFALLSDGKDELRFYFQDNRLVRFIDAAGTILDNARDNYGFTNYEQILTADASNHQ